MSNFSSLPRRLRHKNKEKADCRLSSTPFFCVLAWSAPLADEQAELARQVKEANDIVEVVGGYLTLRPAGASYKALCPFHDDSRPSLDVNPRRQRYHCWACGKKGDVFDFVMEFDHVGFRDALEMLARKAGISLEKNAKFQQNSDRAVMLESVRWAEQQFQQCLLESEELAATARTYLGERKLTGETVRKYGLGYAPVSGAWLVEQARQDNKSLEILEKVGLIRKRKEGKGYFDFFRDRVMFSIRDLQGRTVAFAGRILPNSPFTGRFGKYINTAETPLFHKSELLYGLDQAKHAAAKAGYLAVVEGYTDVLMAHQMGLLQVVAPMGTAFTAQHAKQIRRLVPQVVLVFDADAGGHKGVDSALEIIASHEVSLRIATLPEGLDPFDVLTQRGVEAFTLALTNAQDVLEFKLNQVYNDPAYQGVEGRRLAVDAVLRIIALGKKQTVGEAEVKHELLTTKIAKRFGLKEETVLRRLRELLAARPTETRPTVTTTEEDSPPDPVPVRQAKAKAHERQLLEILLSEPKLVAEAKNHLAADQLEHPGLRRLLEMLYRLLEENETPTLEHLRTRLDHPQLLAKAQELQEKGEMYTDKRLALEDLVRRFQEQRALTQNQEIQQQLYATDDRDIELELLRRLQNRTGS